jgi:hypothetical protein
MRAYGWLGLGLLLISEYCLFRKIEPFHSWFYCFAWWSYILLADNFLLRLRGRSLLCGRRVELWRMLPLSVFIWLIFEAYNLTLANWAYSSVPAQMWIRWLGYAVAFATVLPGVFITADILECLLFGHREAPFASEHEQGTATPRGAISFPLVLLGICLSAAPLLWPRYFFPAVWLGPIFLFYPLLGRFGDQSLWPRRATGAGRRIWSLLIGGLACGLMWEFWNFWAASKWVYSIPFFSGWRVFEMPILGFLGFPPFALECWILYHLSAQVLRRCGRLQVIVWLGIALYCAILFHAIDNHTVLHFVSDLHGRIPIWPFV